VKSASFAILEAVAARRPATPARQVNVGAAERLVTSVAGLGLLAYGMKRGWVGAAASGLAGGALLYRGLRGRSKVYEAIGMSTVGPARVERSATVNRPAAELHRAWRDPAFRARVAQSMETVEILMDSPEEMMSWQRAGGARGGRLSFWKLPAGRGTEVRLVLDQATAAEADRILRRFKQLIEAGEVPTTTGQPSGADW
jgi:uncharacterized membrane protein